MKKMNRLPSTSNNHKICIICEGNEEYGYLNRLKELGVWDSNYDFTLVNAKGNGNIPARYQDSYQNGSYELVLIFCDTERKPHEQYIDIKKKINEFHGTEQAADNVIIFANPCTLQIVIKHWSDEQIDKVPKHKNAPLVQACTGVENYKARADQIIEIMRCVTEDNYRCMYNRLQSMKGPDNQLGCSNFARYIEYFEREDTGWIDELNGYL